MTTRVENAPTKLSILSQGPIHPSRWSRRGTRRSRRPGGRVAGCGAPAPKHVLVPGRRRRIDWAAKSQQAWQEAFLGLTCADVQQLILHAQTPIPSTSSTSSALPVQNEDGALLAVGIRA